jgi:hypothetical protein
MEKIDLKNLTSEISSRKREKKETAVKLGESGKGAMPADQFLHGLWNARNTGLPNAATNALKLIENRIDIKEGKTPTKQLDNLELLQHVSTPQPISTPIQQQRTVRQQPVGQEYNEREEALYAEFERKQKELYETYPSIYPKPQQKTQRTVAGTGQVLNEEVLNEVKADIIGYIKENFAPIVEEAMKDAIMEMYASERIKQVLTENNNELVEKVVIDVLKRIQEKRKLQEQKK